MFLSGNAISLFPSLSPLPWRVCFSGASDLNVTSAFTVRL